MSDTFLISGLIRRRAELSGELSKLRLRADDINRDLAAVDRVLRSLGYQGVPSEDICPVVKREVKVRKGSLSNGVMDIMREASQSLSATDIADLMAERRGLTFKERADRDTFRKHVKESIRRLRQRGIVEMLGKVPMQCGGLPIRLPSAATGL